MPIQRLGIIHDELFHRRKLAGSVVRLGLVGIEPLQIHFRGGAPAACFCLDIGYLHLHGLWHAAEIEVGVDHRLAHGRFIAAGLLVAVGPIDDLLVILLARREADHVVHQLERFGRRQAPAGENLIDRGGIARSGGDRGGHLRDDLRLIG